MAQSITLFDSQFNDVPSILLPKTGGGTAEFTDVTSTTAVASDVASGKYFFNSSGVLTLGTNSGGSGSGSSSGSITQDANGYLILSNQGDGSSGDSWNFTGKNPVKIQEWSEHTSFKTLDADSWTYSTSSAATLRAVTSLSPTITCDYTNYDYVVLFKIKVSYDYGNWSPIAAITDFAYVSVFYSIGYCGTLSAVESATQNSTTYTSSARYRFFYNNSNGVKTLGDSTYGLYSSSAPQVSGSGTSSSMISIFKKPTVYIRGHATYFSETAFNNLDMDNSFYDMKMELWRVDKDTSDRTWVENQIVDLLNNGI